MDGSADPPGLPDNASLLGVSCSSATACTAVGYSSTPTLAARWDGTSWTVQSAPSLPMPSRLFGVSCPSATSCTAFGADDGSPNNQAPIAEAWDGTVWIVQPTPKPTGALATYLTAVSCTSASACIAVGSYRSTANHVLTLAERWDGTSWVVQPTQNPQQQPANLMGVSCPSAAACTAVGWVPGRLGLVTLAEAWNGTAWALQPTPSPSVPVGSRLDGVSCPSAASCMAVGFHASVSPLVGDQPLADAWNGTVWNITPVPSSGFLSEFSACHACRALRASRSGASTAPTVMRL